MWQNCSLFFFFLNQQFKIFAMSLTYKYRRKLFFLKRGRRYWYQQSIIINVRNKSFFVLQAIWYDIFKWHSFQNFFFTKNEKKRVNLILGFINWTFRNTPNKIKINWAICVEVLVLWIFWQTEKSQSEVNYFKTFKLWKYISIFFFIRGLFLKLIINYFII